METTVPPSIPKLNRNKVIFALSEPLRWDILAVLAKGQALSVTDIASQVRRDVDLVSKHLRVLRDVAVVVAERDAGGDGRRQMYEVPACFLTVAGTVDFGFCVLRFG